MARIVVLIDITAETVAVKTFQLEPEALVFSGFIFEGAIVGASSGTIARIRKVMARS